MSNYYKIKIVFDFSLCKHKLKMKVEFGYIWIQSWPFRDFYTCKLTDLLGKCSKEQWNQVELTSRCLLWFFLLQGFSYGGVHNVLHHRVSLCLQLQPLHGQERLTFTPPMVLVMH